MAPEGEDGEHHRHAEEDLDESLDESFPSSDPPSTWAGADSDE